MGHQIHSFTGLRFVMIMIIVISHLEFLGSEMNFGAFGAFYKSHIWNSSFAVNFFFVISGFGMMLSNLERVTIDSIKLPTLRDCLQYGKNHIKKIYIIYILTIIIGFICELCIGISNNNTLSVIVKSIIKLLFAIPLLQSATGLETFSHAFNGVAWFLSSLFCIYLISPLLLYLLRKKSKSLFSDLIFIIFDVFIIIIFAYIFEGIEDYILQSEYIKQFGIKHCTLVYASPYRRVFFVLIGMSLAMIYKRLPKNISNTAANYLEVLIVIFFLLYHYFRNTISEDKLFIYTIDIILCMCFVMVFAFDRGICSKLLASKKMQFLGNMSMYIFLIHYPIRFWIGRIVEHYFDWNITNAILFILFELITTYYLSYLAYQYFSKKITHGLSK